MKKLTILSLIFLSVQLIAQVNSTEKGSLLHLRNFEHPNFSFEEKSQDSLPPISKGKIVTEFFNGNLFGYGLIIPTYLAGAGIGIIVGEKQEMNSKIGALTAFVSLPFSFAYGVYLIGNIGMEEGSYWSTFDGALWGVGVGIGIIAAVWKSDNNSVLIAVALCSPSIGAIIGFNSSRRLESNMYSFKVEQNKYSILKPDFSMQLFRVNF